MGKNRSRSNGNGAGGSNDTGSGSSLNDVQLKELSDEYANAWNEFSDTKAAYDSLNKFIDDIIENNFYGDEYEFEILEYPELLETFVNDTVGYTEYNEASQRFEDAERKLKEVVGDAASADELGSFVGEHSDIEMEDRYSQVYDEVQEELYHRYGTLNI